MIPIENLEDEVWVPIARLPEDYAVSNKGRVKDLKLGALVQPSTGFGGYQTVILRYDGSTIFAYIHILVAEAFLDDYDSQVAIFHVNRRGGDNRVENLSYNWEDVVRYYDEA